jgi:hypothetical protein
VKKFKKIRNVHFICIGSCKGHVIRKPGSPLLGGPIQVPILSKLQCKIKEKIAPKICLLDIGLDITAGKLIYLICLNDT